MHISVLFCAQTRLAAGPLAFCSFSFFIFTADFILRIAFYFSCPLFTSAFVVFNLENFIANDCSCSFSARDNKKIFGHKGHVIAASASSMEFIHGLFLHGYNHIDIFITFLLIYMGLLCFCRSWKEPQRCSVSESHIPNPCCLWNLLL